MTSKDTTPLLEGTSGSEDEMPNLYSPRQTGTSTQVPATLPVDGKDDSEPEVELILSQRSDVKRRLMAVSNSGSMMHLIKGNVGTGILAMPSAIMYAGLWVGFFGLGAIGIIAVHCMHLLVQTSQRLCAKTQTNSLDYGEVAEKAFECFENGSLRRFSRIARLTVNVFICITQFGFCIVYVLFVAQNVQQFIEHFADFRLRVQVYEAGVLLFLIPFSFIKSLKVLAPFSLFANIITFIGLIIILEYCVHDLPNVSSYPAFNSWATLPLFFGIAIYAFEGIAVVLPIENAMKTPRDFRGLTGVLNTGMVIVTVMYMAVGFYGYLQFGKDVLGSITLNLPNTPLYLTTKLMFALTIFISYGLQFYVPAVVVFPVIARKCMPNMAPSTADAIIRVCAVIGTFLLAAVIPHLDLMISLIGALASSALALIIPPILEVLTLYPDQLGRYNWILIKDIAIMLFGLLGFLTGTVTTLIKIVDTFKNGDL